MFEFKYLKKYINIESEEILFCKATTNWFVRININSWLDDECRECKKCKIYIFKAERTKQIIIHLRECCVLVAWREQWQGLDPVFEIYF